MGADLKYGSDEAVLIAGTGLCAVGELAQGRPEVALLMLAAVVFVILAVSNWTRQGQ